MKEISCGVILYRVVDGKREYALVMEASGSYSFPKGHINPGETPVECALRECFEETGAKPILNEKLKRTITYKIPTGNIKEVTYFAGRFDGELMPNDTDIMSAKFYPIDACLNLLRFKTLKDLIIEFDFMLEVSK